MKSKPAMCPACGYIYLKGPKVGDVRGCTLTNKKMTLVAAPELEDIRPGEEIYIEWPRSKMGVKPALFERWNAKGEPVVRVEMVDAKGTLLGTYGAPRTFTKSEIAGRRLEMS